MTEQDQIDWPSNPFPVGSPARLLTPRRFWAGEGHGLTRTPRIATILGVPLDQRSKLVQWLSNQGLYIEPPTLGPWTEKPLAGCVDWDALRKAVKKALKAGPLPFTAEHLQP